MWNRWVPIDSDPPNRDVDTVGIVNNDPVDDAETQDEVGSFGLGLSEPVLPDYRGPNLSRVVPGCLIDEPGQRPEWFPTDLAQAERILLLLVDGLGFDQLQSHLDHAPHLATFSGSPITTVAPSTTATALTSLTTGATPLEHGIIGYRMAMDGVVMNTLRWGSDRADMRKVHPPDRVQPVPPFVGISVPVLSRKELETSAFTHAHLRGSVPLGWRAMSSIVEQARQLFESGESFVYAYYDGLDKIAHERGFGPYYETELRLVDWLIGQLLESLPSGTTIAVTADHGQVAVGSRLISLPGPILQVVDYQSGEGRFRWLHARRGRVEELVVMAQEQFGHFAWVRTRDQILDEEWFGSRGTSAHGEEAIRRMGDVALVPYEDVSFDDPADSGPFPLECRHGSLTRAEMLVPLIARSVS